MSDAVALAAGDVLRTGDATGSNAVTLHYGRERTQISLSAESELKVLNWAKGKHLELREGKLEATVAPTPIAPFHAFVLRFLPSLPCKRTYNRRLRLRRPC